MTTWKTFIDKIEAEAQEESQDALNELEAFKKHFAAKLARQLKDRDGRQRTRCEEDLAQQPCLLEGFFKEQQKLPPSLRSTGALISCPCPRCSPAML